MYTVVSVCVCQAIMAAPDFVAFKETPDAEKPVPPCGHCDKKQIVNEHWYIQVFSAETLEESRWYTMIQKHRSILIEKFVIWKPLAIK